MLGVRTLSMSAISEVIVCSEPNKEATTTSATVCICCRTLSFCPQAL